MDLMQGEGGRKESSDRGRDWRRRNRTEGFMKDKEVCQGKNADLRYTQTFKPRSRTMMFVYDYF